MEIVMGARYVPIPYVALELIDEPRALLDLYRRGHATRWGWLTMREADMMRAWGVSKRRARDVVAALVDAGLAEIERGTPTQQGGRATRLRVLDPQVLDRDADRDADRSESSVQAHRSTVMDRVLDRDLDHARDQRSDQTLPDPTRGHDDVDLTVDDPSASRGGPVEPPPSPCDALPVAVRVAGGGVSPGRASDPLPPAALDPVRPTPVVVATCSPAAFLPLPLAPSGDSSSSSTAGPGEGLRRKRRATSGAPLDPDVERVWTAYRERHPRHGPRPPAAWGVVGAVEELGVEGCLLLIRWMALGDDAAWIRERGLDEQAYPWRPSSRVGHLVLAQRWEARGGRIKRPAALVAIQGGACAGRDLDAVSDLAAFGVDPSEWEGLTDEECEARARAMVAP